MIYAPIPLAQELHKIREPRKYSATHSYGVRTLMAMEVVDLQDPVQVGENTTYEIRVKNQGSAKDLNVQVQGQLPASLQFVDARGDTSVQNQGQQLQFGKIGELAPGEMISWCIQAKANEAGKVNFKVQMTSDATKHPVNEEEPTTLY